MFDWQTEEDINWDALSEQAEKESQQGPSGWHMSWKWVVVAVLVLGGVFVTTLSYRVRERIETAESAVTEEILSSYNLLMQSARHQDGDLFASFLSGRDAKWADSMYTVAVHGAYLEREPFGLDYVQTADPTVTLDPTLLSAEMTTLTAYAFPVGNGITETVVLSQTAVYRRGEAKWLLAPPKGEFWGETRSINGQLLNITYPARDEEIVKRLAPHLENRVLAGCDEMYPCGGQFTLTIQFSTDPLALDPAIDPSARTLQLPTPTLVGIPTDQLGYFALRQGYTQLVLSKLMTPAQET